MRFYIFIISLLLITGFPAHSTQFPRYLGTEKKFRSYIYNPNQVYRYLGHYTYQGFIEFSGDEKIGTISMGNPTAWMFQQLNNRLFLKPIGEGNSETNMTVITDKRVYQFELTAKNAKGVDDQDLIFVAKFVYPDEKDDDKNIKQFPKTPASDDPDLRNLALYNFNYQYTGEPAIAPIKVFDNGQFTYFQFPDKSADIPAIFSVDSSGFESLVNFRATSNYIIVEKLAPQFTLRNGSDIVCIYNTSMYTSGRLIPKSKSKATAVNSNQFQAGAAPTIPPSMSSSPSVYPMPTQGPVPNPMVPTSTISRIQ